MRQSWLLLVLKNRRPLVPPELYTVREELEREARRWMWMLFHRRRRTFDGTSFDIVQLGVQHTVLMTELDLPESWVGDKMWACMRWDEVTFPKIKLELVSGDGQEGKAWVLGQNLKKLAPSESTGSDCFFEMTFPAKSGVAYAGSHLVKHVYD